MIAQIDYHDTPLKYIHIYIIIHTILISKSLNLNPQNNEVQHSPTLMEDLFRIIDLKATRSAFALEFGVQNFLKIINFPRAHQANKRQND